MKSFRLIQYKQFWAIVVFLFFMGRNVADENNAPKNDAFDDAFRVAVLHTADFSGRHHDEFDVPLKRLGWSCDKFDSTTKGMEQLVRSFDRYDIVLTVPLFNYENTDLTRFGPAFRKFVENGGAIVITDALYPQTYQWLTSIDPSLIVGREGDCKAGRDPFGTVPPHPLRFVPNILRDGNSWGHLTVPKNHSWEIVAFCGDGDVGTVMKRLGRGFVYVTGFRQSNTETLENLRAALELQRIDLQVTDFRMPKSSMSAGALSLTLQNSSDAAAEILVRLFLTPRNETGGNDGTVVDKRIKLPKSKENATVSIPYTNKKRGGSSMRLVLEKDSVKATIFDRLIERPDLLTLSPPCYRGFTLNSELERTGTIFPGISIAPDDEDVASLHVTTYVTDGEGKILGKDERRKVEQWDFRFPLEVGPLPVGAYRLHAELFSTDQSLEKRSVDFEVLDAAKCKTFIDDDMNLLVDGKPFFPIGLYHISPEDLEIYGKEIGINLIQLWNWHPIGLDIAEKLGIKVLWEMNHRNRENIYKNIPALIGNASIILWYGRDEPFEADFESALAMHEAFHQVDKGRPTFMVTYTPRLFDQHAKLADIMATDAYPFPHRPLTDISDFIDLAWKATKGEKPVFAVLQSFGADADPAMRAMAYLALTHEARGIFWYPWDDGKTEGKPGLGLKYHPTTREIVKGLAAEIRVLSPALLNKHGRRPFTSPDEKIHGLFCNENNEKKYVLLVNPHDESNTILPNEQKELKDIALLREVFGTKTISSNSPLRMQPYMAIAYEY